MGKQLNDLKEAVENLRKQHAQADAEIAQVQETLELSGFRVTCWVNNSAIQLNLTQLKDAKDTVTERSPEGADSDLAHQIGATDVQYQLGFCEIDDTGEVNKRWCLAVRSGTSGTYPPASSGGGNRTAGCRSRTDRPR